MLFAKKKATPQFSTELLYPDPNVSETNPQFYERFCVWADQNDFAKPQFLLPQIRQETRGGLYAFEQRFISSGLPAPTRAEIEQFGEWEYQIHWGEMATQEGRVLPDDQFGPGRSRTVDDVRAFHRYRVSLLVDLAAEVASDLKPQLSVLDVACHLGLYSLEFAEAGFKRVTGIDMRAKNIAKADFLKRTFQCQNVNFHKVNARNFEGHAADVVFCGGLLYHVTFPFELMTSLYNATRQFLVFDSMCQNHPFSGFHIVGGRDKHRSVDGDAHVEFMPTYRAIIDLLRLVGFEKVYEVIGDKASDVHLYRTHNVRSFIATKHGFDVPQERVTSLV